MNCPDSYFPKNYISLPQSRWHEAPIEAQKTTASSILEGVPTWICLDTDSGKYFVAQTSGQGSYIVWRGGEESRANQPVTIFNFTFVDESSDPEHIAAEIDSWKLVD